MPFSRELLKKTKCVSYILHIIFFFFFFFFIEEKTISTLFFIIFYLQQTRLRILCGSLRRTIQIIQYKFSSNDISSNIFFFFFHTPIQPLIAIVSRVTIIYIPFSPHTRRSTFLLITREHSGALIWATGEIRRPRLLHA